MTAASTIHCDLHLRALQAVGKSVRGKLWWNGTDISENQPSQIAESLGLP